MGADNWADCPRCRHAAEQARAKQKAEADAAYGVLPADEWDRLRQEAAKPADYDRDTFREDYEQGLTEDGEYFVRYLGRCNVCGLAHSFKHSAQVWKP